MRYLEAVTNIAKSRLIAYSCVAAVAMLVALHSHLLASNKVIFLPLTFIGAILIFKSPALGIYLLTFEFFLIQRSYVDIGGVSVLRVVAVLICISCLIREKKIAGLGHAVTILLTIFTFYQFFSYYSYFHTFDFTIFNNLVFYFLVLWAFDFESPKNLQPLSLAVFCGGIILCIQGLLAFLIGGSLNVGSYFGNKHQVAFYIILSIPFTIIFIEQNRNLFVKNLARLTVWLFIAYIFLTFGRLNSTIVFITLICFIIFNFGQSLINKPKLIIAFSTLLVLTILLPKLPKDFLKLSDRDVRFDVTDDEFIGWTSGRARIYRDGVTMWHEFPVFGMGYKSFSHVSNIYNTWLLKNSSERISMHSTHLQYLAEMGVVGLSLYWIIIVIIIVYALKARRHFQSNGNKLLENLSVAVFIGMISFFVGGFFDNHGVLYRQYFLLAALTTGYLTLKKEKSKRA